MNAAPAPPVDLDQLAALTLQARVLANAMALGMHRSVRLGGATDFAEHQAYAPGDDIRRIDWRALGRLDRVYVRRFQEESRMAVAVLLDTSSSMGFAGTSTTPNNDKLSFAKVIVATLLHLAAQQRDAPGVSLFAGERVAHIQPSSRVAHLQHVLAVVQHSQADGTTQLDDTLMAVASQLRPRGLVVLVSDLIDIPTSTLAHLRPIRARGSDAIVLHVLHRDELSFPLDGVVQFNDMEGNRHQTVDAPLVRDAYLTEVDRFCQQQRVAVEAAGARYLLVCSDEPARQVLTRLLSLLQLKGRR
jgi:uncharacterized protein (DUF58 family)